MVNPQANRIGKLGMTDAEHAPFTVKAFSVEAREVARKAAYKQGEHMGVWLERAVRNQAEREAGERVLPPVKPGQSVTPFDLVKPTQEMGKPLDLAGLATALQAVATVHEAAGLPVPKVLARNASALLLAQLRAARGLPVKPRRLIGQTVEGT